MSEYNITLSEKQEAALQRIAADVGKTAQDVLDEQVFYYIKRMLEHEADRTGIDHQADGLSDADKAELVATLTNEKAKFLAEKGGM